MMLLYTRVSTEEQAGGEKTSLSEQERMLRGYAQMRGAQPFDIAVFSDAGVSGVMPLEQRPAGNELLAAMRKGDVVVAVKLDRLFRSARDALNSAETFKQKGVDLVLVDLGNDPVTGNGTAKLFFTLLAAVAEFERDRTAERMDVGRKAKVAKGGYMGGHAPYGCRREGDGAAATLVPVAAEQEVLALVREMHRDKLSLWRICRTLEQRGMHNREGNPFQWKQVRSMVSRLDSVAMRAATPDQPRAPQ